MDFGNHLGLSQHQNVTRVLEINRVFGESFTAIIGFRRGIPLNHRSHRAVKHENSFGEQLFEEANGASGHKKSLETGKRLSV